MADALSSEEVKELAKTLGETISDSTDDELHSSNAETIDDGQENSEIHIEQTEDDEDTTPSISGDHILHKFEISSEIQERYATGEVLGEGSGGAVFDLTDNNLDRTIAVKFLSKEYAKSKFRIEKFMREALITSRLDHPNILPIYDLESSKDKQIYYTMKKVEGIPLTELTEVSHDGTSTDEQELINASNSLGEIVNTFIKIGETIAYAHSRGIIHRDIKPDNVMLGHYGEVRVVDWGIAVDTEKQKKHNGKMSGTPHYMSPEQANCEQADERSDIYSIGATLFHVLFKRTPIIAKSHESFWQQKKNGIYQIPNEAEQEHVPAPLLAICFKCMGKERENRYQTSAELVEDLKNFQIGGSIGAYHYSFVELAKKWIKHNINNLKWAALVFIIIGAASTYFYQQHQREYAGWGSPIYTETFDNAEQWNENWVLTSSGAAEIADKVMQTKGGSGFYAFYNHPIQGGMRIEFDAKILPGTSPGDMSVIFAPDIHDTVRNSRTPRNRYYLQHGSQGNESSAILGPNGRLDYVINPLKPDTVYRVRGEIDGKSIRLYLDNKLICSYDLLFPLTSGYIGIYCFYPGKQIDNIRIYSKELPEITNIIKTGDLLFDNKLYDLAAQRYLKISQTHPKTQLGDEALYKYALCMHKLGKEAKAFEIWDTLKNSSYKDHISYYRWSDLYTKQSFDTLLKEMDQLFAQSEKNTRHNIKAKWATFLKQAQDNHHMKFLEDLLTFRSKHFPNDQVFSFQTFRALRLLGEASKVLELFPQQTLIKCRAMLAMGRFDEIIKDYPEHKILVSLALSLSGQYNKVIAEYSEFQGDYLTSLIHAGYLEKAKQEFAGTKHMPLILFEAGDYDELIKHYPDSSTANHAKYIKTGDLDAYLRSLDQEALNSGYYQTLIALRKHIQGDKSAINKIKSLVSQVNATELLWATNMFERRFIDAVLTALDGDDQLLESRVRSLYKEKREMSYMRPWHCAALLLGEIDEETFLKQPFQWDIKEDLHLYKGIHEDLQGNRQAAIKHYTALKNLKHYESRDSITVEIFVDYRLKALQ